MSSSRKLTSTGKRSSTRASSVRTTTASTRRVSSSARSTTRPTSSSFSVSSSSSTPTPEPTSSETFPPSTSSVFTASSSWSFTASSSGSSIFSPTSSSPSVTTSDLPSSNSSNSGPDAEDNISGGSEALETTRPPTSAIVGGVVGGLLLLCLIITIGLFYRRRRKRQFLPKVHLGDDKRHPFIPMQSLHASTDSFTPVPYTFTRPSFQPGEDIVKAAPTRHVPARSASSEGAAVPESSSDALSDGIDRPSSTSGTRFTSGGGTLVEWASRANDFKVVRHEDSGARMKVDEQDVLELPPVYTPR